MVEARMEKTAAFPLIELAGTPEEIGHSYGRQARDRIHRSIEIYRSAFEGVGVEWDLARRLARSFLPRIDAYDAALTAELRAVALGADVPPEDIIALNARTELLYGARAHGRSLPAAAAVDAEPDGCTGAIVQGELTADGHTLHAQNWDWRDECGDVGVVLAIAPKDGPRMLSFVEAGMAGRAGVNEHGISITGNFLGCQLDGGQDGVPIPFIRRRVLQSASLATAIQAVTKVPRAFSNNIMISHAGGEAIDLETTPGECFWMLPEAGLLVHANHFVSPVGRTKVTDTHLPQNPDTIHRDVRVRRFLQQHAGNITRATLADAFQDRYGSPRAVCRSPCEGMGGRISSTVATIIMDTTERRMWIAPRPYGPHEFTEYGLDG